MDPATSWREHLRGVHISEKHGHGSSMPRGGREALGPGDPAGGQGLEALS